MVASADKLLQKLRYNTLQGPHKKECYMPDTKRFKRERFLKTKKKGKKPFYFIFLSEQKKITYLLHNYLKTVEKKFKNQHFRVNKTNFFFVLLK